jgi:hypothetical protein
MMLYFIAPFAFNLSEPDSIASCRWSRMEMVTSFEVLALV